MKTRQLIINVGHFYGKILTALAAEMQRKMRKIANRK